MKKKVLVIEDSWTVQKLSGIGLQYGGYEVIKAGNGIEALALLNKHTPNLILLDINMPKMGGFEFLEKIKKDEQRKNIPVIILTTEGQKESQTKGLSLGAARYMVKPFDTQGLLDCIAEVLKKAA